MAKLIIGSPETVEKETEVRFWLECDGGDVNIVADAGTGSQIIGCICPDGSTRAVAILNDELIEFFNGNNDPFANLD